LDIIAYLDEQTIRECGADGFPGWADVKRAAGQVPFKDAAARLAGRPFTVGFIKSVVAAMVESQRPALDDLPFVMSEIIKMASTLNAP
jgi:hypothetical protein